MNFFSLLNMPNREFNRKQSNVYRSGITITHEIWPSLPGILKDSKKSFDKMHDLFSDIDAMIENRGFVDI